MISAMTYRGLCAFFTLTLATFAQSGTVPLILEGNVPLIDLEFVRPDGSTATGRFVVDSGGGAFILTEKLANKIGLKPSTPPVKDDEGEFAPAPAPKVRIGGMPLDLKDARILIQYGSERFDARDAADGLFPGHVLERYDAIFDYPGHKFTLAAPVSVRPRGVAFASPVRRQNGFVRIEANVGGPYGRVSARHGGELHDDQPHGDGGVELGRQPMAEAGRSDRAGQHGRALGRAGADDPDPGTAPGRFCDGWRGSGLA
jgi:hypothetical protein